MINVDKPRSPKQLLIHQVMMLYLLLKLLKHLNSNHHEAYTTIQISP